MTRKSKGKLESMDKFSDLAIFLMNADIDWTQKVGDKGEITLQGNFLEDGKRYRLKLSYEKEDVMRHRPGFCSSGVKIGYSRSPLYSIYRFKVAIVDSRKNPIVMFDGKSDSTCGGGIFEVMERCEKGEKFFTKKEFDDLWDCIAGKARARSKKSIIFLARGWA